MIAADRLGREQMKNTKKRIVLEYVWITLAVILMDIGIYVFKFPNNFSFGGVSGMAVVISNFTILSPSQINLVINILLLILGFVILGKDFGIRPAYVTAVFSM